MSLSTEEGEERVRRRVRLEIGESALTGTPRNTCRPQKPKDTDRKAQLTVTALWDPQHQRPMKSVSCKFWVSGCFQKLSTPHREAEGRQCGDTNTEELKPKEANQKDTKTCLDASTRRLRHEDLRELEVSLAYEVTPASPSPKEKDT